jgi:proteasome lid subunit RPN8/RPN11
MTSASTSSEQPARSDASLEAKPESNPIEAQPETGLVSKAPSSRFGRSILHGSVQRQMPVSITVTQSALNQLENHCYSIFDSEIGGVLLGKVDRQASRNDILVQAALPVRSDDRGPVHFTFSADSWAILHQERAQKFPQMDIVGWYHTHPGLGVFYSSDDVVVHSAAFVLPWHVGLVIDPVHQEGSWFGWRTVAVDHKESELAPIEGYYELLDEQDESNASWKLVEASIWQTSYGLPNPSSVSDQVYVPANDWPALPPINPWWGVLLGGTSLLLTLLLLLDRLIALVR